MKYEIKHSCGHVETVQLIGKGSDRERRIAWLESQPCPECRRAAEAEHAQKVAEEYALPDLVGSEKQIAWANKIRANVISRYESAEKNREIIPAKDGGKVLCIRYNQFLPVSQEMLDGAYQRLLSHESASWWIDMRDFGVCSLLSDEVESLKKEAADVPEQEQPSEPVNDSNPNAPDCPGTVCPENWNNRGEAIVSIADNVVSVRYQKDDEFRAVVKSLGYSWDANTSSWCKIIGITTGSADDRASEVANKLLAVGFAVNVPNGKIRDAAINATYVPEHKRWITFYNNIGVTIEVEYGNDDIYQASRKIPGSKWERGYGVVVPAESFAEIRDFAEIYDYRLTPGTEQALIGAEEAHNQKLAGAVKVSSPAVPEQKSASEKLEEKLNVSGVIDDLRDDN